MFWGIGISGALNCSILRNRSAKAVRRMIYETKKDNVKKDGVCCPD